VRKAKREEVDQLVYNPGSGSPGSKDASIVDNASILTGAG
jgi:hypothetical protein